MPKIDDIHLQGCCQHNLRDLDVSLPATGLSLITGTSGSGKSSLAFATLHAESRRRYLESLSSTERGQFEDVSPPQIDSADNLPLTVAIRSNSLAAGSRNTLGTETGIIPLFQMLWVSSAEAVCPKCSSPVSRWSTSLVLQELADIPEGTRLQFGFPLPPGLSAADAKSWLTVAGFQRVVLSGRVCSLSELSDATHVEGLLVIVDRVKSGSTSESRMRESLELCFRAGRGKAVIYSEATFSSDDRELETLDGKEWCRRIFSREYDCVQCGRSLLEPVPALFRWSSPMGACATCQGRGERKIKKSGEGRSDSWEVCPDCRGQRLNADALAYRICGRSLADIHSLTVAETSGWLDSTKVESHSLEELKQRLTRLQELGFERFQLSIPVRNLSETERKMVALANAATEPLSGALYLLEEPYSGLRASDWPNIDRLIHQMQAGGAGVGIIQAEEAPCQRLDPDQVIRLGPGAGDAGGELVKKRSQLEVVALPEHKPAETLTLHGFDWPWASDEEIGIVRRGVTVLAGAVSTRPVMLVRECLQRLAEDSGLFEQVVALARESRRPHPRLTVAAAIQIYGGMRTLLAGTDDAKKRNVTAGDFSLHKKDGVRCFRCEGTGRIAVDLDFLPDFERPCPECGGSRFDSSISEIRYRGLTLPEILELTAERAFRFFKGQHRLQKKLQLLKQVRLGYLRLGQAVTELSKGERQRLRLASVLAKTGGAETLLLIEELTVGLAAEELPSLLSVLREFTTAGHSVLLVDAHEYWQNFSDKFQKLSPPS